MIKTTLLLEFFYYFVLMARKNKNFKNSIRVPEFDPRIIHSLFISIKHFFFQILQFKIKLGAKFQED